ncbi:hypothetical protein BRADI_4g28089v3, partial [Brachypodium distachyon]
LQFFLAAPPSTPATRGAAALFSHTRDSHRLLISQALDLKPRCISPQSIRLHVLLPLLHTKAPGRPSLHFTSASPDATAGRHQP